MSTKPWEAGYVLMLDPQNASDALRLCREEIERLKKDEAIVREEIERLQRNEARNAIPVVPPESDILALAAKAGFNIPDVETGEVTIADESENDISGNLLRFAEILLGKYPADNYIRLWDAERKFKAISELTPYRFTKLYKRHIAGERFDVLITEVLCSNRKKT